MEMRKTLKKVRGWFPQEPTLPKHLKIELDSHKRDWFPKDPLIAAIKTTTDEKFNRWALCPFLTPGALMIISALLLAPFGVPLVYVYLLSIFTGTTAVLYSSFLTGIMSIGAFILGFLSGILLLANRSIVKAAACIGVVFSFGIAMLVIPSFLDEWIWGSCLIVASPMIALSAASLILVGLNYKKLKNSLITKEDDKISKTDQTTIPSLQDSAL